jgi:hypothetical protein
MVFIKVGDKDVAFHNVWDKVSDNMVCFPNRSEPQVCAVYNPKNDTFLITSNDKIIMVYFSSVKGESIIKHFNNDAMMLLGLTDDAFDTMIDVLEVVSKKLITK